MNMMERHFCLDDSPMFKMLELDSVDSTNNFLRHYRASDGQRMVLVTAEYQTSGRGSGSNVWESQRGKNLLFSFLLHPKWVDAEEMFGLSEVAALAVKEALEEYAEGFSVKWPNDIYFGNKKIAGLLIENVLEGHCVGQSVIGVGLNVNQLDFVSDAPNPVSLARVLGHEVERRFVLEKVVEHFSHRYDQLEHEGRAQIHADYLSCLFRKGEEHLYVDSQGLFQAVLQDVELSGHLILRDSEGRERRYAFKEVQYII